MSSEKFFNFGNIFKFHYVRSVVVVGDFRICSKKIFQTKTSTCSIFELENFFWCQKLRLDFLISNLLSEKNSEVGNVLKIDREYGDFCMAAGRGPDSSIFELGRTFWCQKLCLDLLNSEQVSEKI